MIFNATLITIVLRNGGQFLFVEEEVVPEENHQLSVGKLAFIVNIQKI